MPCGIFLSWKLLIFGFAQGNFSFPVKWTKPELSSSVTLTSENGRKQYLIRIIFEVLTYKFTVVNVLEKVTPLLIFMLGQTWMLHWFTGLGYLVLDINNLATLPDFWCSFNMISHMWRTDTHSDLSSFSLPKLSRLDKCQARAPSAQSIFFWYPCTEGKVQHLLYMSAANQWTCSS